MPSKFYVSEKGSDMNNGTSPSTPWKHKPQSPKAIGRAAAFLIKLVIGLLLITSANAQTLVHSSNNTAATWTVTSTTAGNVMTITTSSTSVPGSVVLDNGSGGLSQTATLVGNCAPGANFQCAYRILNLTGGQTRIVCGTCGTPNAFSSGEWSGVSAVQPIDTVSGCNDQPSGGICQITGQSGAAVRGVVYTPGYSSEGVHFAASCTGNSLTPTFSNLTSTSSALPNNNPVAWGIASAARTITAMIPTAACSSSNGIAIGVVGSGATESPAAQANFQDYSAQATTGSATVTAFVLNVGDLVALLPWGTPSWGLGTLTLGSQNAICPAASQGVTNSVGGMPGICYVIANTSGSLTVTFTPTGSPTSFQVGYIDYSLSPNTVIAVDTGAHDSCTSGCTEGTTVVTPAVTPAAAGELLINYVATQNHALGPNSPWDCYAYYGTGETLDCTMVTTKNATAWINNSGSSSTATAMRILTNNDTYQSVVLALGLTASTAPPGWQSPTVGPSARISLIPVSVLPIVHQIVSILHSIEVAIPSVLASIAFLSIIMMNWPLIKSACRKLVRKKVKSNAIVEALERDLQLTRDRDRVLVKRKER